jgi:signal transduction histidine kinase
MPPSVQPARARGLSWVPRGASLSRTDWHWRHSAVCLVLAAHVPVLLVWALVQAGAGGLWPVLLPAGALVVACVPTLGRRLRSMAAVLGLMATSALVISLSDGAVEAHFHYFVTITVIALYQDWVLYLLAIGVVLLQHGLMVMVPGTPGETGRWGWALLQAAFLLAQSAVLVLFWRAHELSRESEERARVELERNRDTVQARLAATDKIRDDLIGTVSHEFRTPLTSIRAAALTLLKRGDRLDKESRDTMLTAVLDQQERLSRLLENMLLAATATAVDPDAATEVDAVAAEVAMVVAGQRGSAPVSVVVEAGLTARIDRHALHQVLANLVDNALTHGAPGSTPLVAGGHDDKGVWLTVSNEGRVLDLTRKGQLFQPFTQVSTGATRDREGLGVGLYVVRRLVEVYGGSVDVRSDSGWVTVEVRLQPGGTTATLPDAVPVAG